MAVINGFIIICLLISLQFLLGLLFFLSDKKENKCEMTYMFEYPQFVLINISPHIDKFYRKYGLYAYSEGRFTERARNMLFDGIPVLFIPGNKGSEKQVRSFASVALRKALNSRPGFHFDFFTVDLNEEFSALNGALLEQQTTYVSYCIRKILSLYNNNPQQYKPKSVILIGHSMGGIVAEGLLAALPENSTLIPLVITLATYHERPPFTLDLYINDYYNKIETNIDKPANTTLISIAGGYNDLLVPAHLTKPKRSQHLHVVSTSIPKVWLTVDHLCILWCKQLVLAVTRALFECVNVRTRQIVEDPNYRIAVFHNHLVHNSGTKVQHRDRYDLPVSTRVDDDEWIEKLARQYTVRLPHGTKHTQWYMVRLLDQPKHEALALIAINLKVMDWVFVCPAVHIKGQSKVCMEGKHLSHLSEISPTVAFKRRTLRVNLHELKRNYTSATHVVVKVPPTDDPVVLHVDVFSPSDRVINVTLPKWWSFPKYFVLEETADNVVHYELRFPHLTHMVQSYLLYVEPTLCKNIAHHATASLIVPWAYQDVHTFITNTEKSPLELRLYSSKPHSASNLTAFVRLTLDPACKYSISIKSSYLGMLGQMVRLYTPLLIANTAAVILLCLRSQLHSIAQRSYCLLFFTALKEGVKPYYILTSVKVASKVLSLKIFTDYLPMPDCQILAEDGSEMFLLPLVLYMCSVGIVWLLAIALAVSLIVCESTVHKVALKLLARNVAGTLQFSDWLMSGLQKVPSVVAVTLILITLNTCGGLALCLGTIFYFLKLTQMSQDYIEDIVSSVVKYIATEFRKKFWKTKTQSKESMQETTEKKEEITEAQKDKEKMEKTEQDDKPEGGDNVTLKAEAEWEEKNLNEKKEEGEEETSKLESTGESRSIVEEEYNDSETNATMGSDETPEIQDSILNLPSRDGIYFHFTMFLLWLMITFLTFPSVLTWAHNFKYSSRLKPDPSFVPGLVLSSCAMFIWQMEIPKLDRQWYKELSYTVYFLVAFSLTYATLSLYRLVFVLSGVYLLITLHQLFAPKVQVSLKAQEEDVPDSASIENIKAKWE